MERFLGVLGSSGRRLSPIPFAQVRSESEVGRVLGFFFWASRQLDTTSRAVFFFRLRRDVTNHSQIEILPYADIHKPYNRFTQPRTKSVL